VICKDNAAICGLFEDILTFICKVRRKPAIPLVRIYDAQPGFEPSISRIWVRLANVLSSEEVSTSLGQL
jgi:hypothetical protein